MKTFSEFKKFISLLVPALAFATLAAPLARADELSAKLAPMIEEGKKIAAEAAIVSAVKEANSAPRADYKDMSNEKWKSLAVLDPLVRNLSKNTAAEAIKAKKTEKITEAFLSSANGEKVALLAKTTSWTHKGSPKHDLPMSGKVWIGKPETDQSTGMQQVQFAVPVMDGGKPIGSLVIGVSVNKL